MGGKKTEHFLCHHSSNNASVPLLSARLLVAGLLLQGLQLLDALLQIRRKNLDCGDLTPERDDLGVGGAQPLPRIQCILR